MEHSAFHFGWPSKQDLRGAAHRPRAITKSNANTTIVPTKPKASIVPSATNYAEEHKASLFSFAHLNIFR
jgi:hypothetical protein